VLPPEIAVDRKAVRGAIGAGGPASRALPDDRDAHGHPSRPDWPQVAHILLIEARTAMERQGHRIIAQI
jgi:hypothetical protein